MKKCLLLIFIMLLGAMSLSAQEDAFNLPAPLYVLTNDGQVNRYGVGSDGISTVTPQDDFVVDFGVAPDGVWLAYRTEQGLVLYNPQNQERIAVDDSAASVPSVRGQGSTIAWNATGEALAVTTLTGARVYLNVQDNPTILELNEGPFVQLSWSPDGAYLAGAVEGNIWWLYRREGDNLLLTSAIPSSDGLAWYNAHTVAFVPAEGGLRLMDLSLANTQSILMDDTWTYHLPGIGTDGTLLVFGLQKGDTIPAGYGRLLGLPAGEPRVDNLSQLSIELAGLRWIPGDDSLMAFRDGTLALIDPVTAEAFTLPMTDVVAYDWAAQAAPSGDALTASQPLYFIAEDTQQVAQVWRLAGDGSAAQPITQAAEPVTGFTLTPQKTHLAYTSGNQLLYQALTDGQVTALVRINANKPQPAFSTGGQQIAYVDNGIWLISTQGGLPTQLIADESDSDTARQFRNPRFSPDDRYLLVEVVRPQITVPGVLDITTGVLQEIAQEQQAHWLADGRILLYGRASGTRPGGLSIVGPASPNQLASLIPASISVVSAQETPDNQLQLALTNAGTGPELLQTATFNRTDNQLSESQTIGFITGAQLSPDGQFIAGYPWRTAASDHARGPLLLIDRTTGATMRLASPALIWDLTW